MAHRQRAVPCLLRERRRHSKGEFFSQLLSLIPGSLEAAIGQHVIQRVSRPRTAKRQPPPSSTRIVPAPRPGPALPRPLDPRPPPIAPEAFPPTAHLQE